MEISQAEIVIQSIVNQNCYYLFKEKIIIKQGDGNYKEIYLPHDVNIICFYDMFYVANKLRVIIATRTDYDFISILDEENLSLCPLKLSK